MRMLPFVLVACGGQASDTGLHTVGPNLRVVPKSIDFGRVKVGDTATTSLTLRNVGDEAVELDGVFPSPDGVVVDDFDRIRLGPGEEQVIPIRWTPMTTDAFLEAHLDIPVIARPPVTLTVPVVGVPSWAWMHTPPMWYDGFGTVAIGCAPQVAFEIENAGSEDLTLESVTFSGPDEFTWSGLETPLVLAPGAATSFDATFLPTTAGYAEATVHIESDDPDEPVADRVLPAQAVEAPGPVSLSWTVPPRPTAITSVIAVNHDAVVPAIHEAFESFFSVLRDSDVPFRVSIIGDVGDPSPSGPYPYIDDGFSALECADAVGAMLDGISGDEDRSFWLLEAALEDHRDWLRDDAPWSSSTLHLTVVSTDREQSPAPAEYYVEQYSEWKDGAGPFFVNGIAGPLPLGCDYGSVIGGRASENLFDATEQTGGVFLSICDDLTTSARVLAADMTGIFPLTDAPVDSTMTVTVDGTEVASGWTYLPESNSIRFDDKSYPAVGSVVGIEYGPLLVCD